VARAAVVAPVVNAVDPHSGTSAGMTTVAIFGTGFTGATGVQFGTVPVRNFFVADDTRIFTSSPPGIGVVDVRVQTAGGMSGISTADQFAYVAPGAPVVNAIYPRQGTTAGGTNLTVYGSGFSTVASVSFGSNSLPCFSPQFGPAPASTPALRLQRAMEAASTSAGIAAGGGGFGFAPCQIGGDGQLFVSGPPGTGTVHITVTTGGQPPITSATSAIDQFTYTTPVAPVVYGVGPNHGSANGGTNVAIFGSGLSGARSVAFGTNSIPACGPVVAPTRSSVVRLGPTRWAVAPAPRLAAGGGPGPGCFSPSGSDTGLNVPAPPGTASPTAVDVIVTTGAGSSAANAAAKFTYEAPGPPEVDAVDPNHGTAVGGTFVSVFGQSFTGATAVDFGTTKLMPCAPGSFGSPCFNQNDDQHIFVNLAPGGTANTSVDVKVEVGALISLPGAADKYTFDTPVAPVIYAIDPSHGSASGGTNFTLFGSAFSGTTDVMVGSTHLVPCGPTSPPACFNQVGDENIFVTTPPGSVGTATVKVTTQTLPAATTNFTYDPPVRPTVDAVSPSSSPSNQPTQAWITGKGLSGATGVTVGGQVANFFAPFGTDNVLQVNVPPYSGTATPPVVADVVVTSPAGTSAIMPSDHFTYTAAVPPPLPTVSAVSPSAGAITGGTQVFVSGHAFFNATDVTFGTTAVARSNWQIMGDNLILATSPATAASTVHVVVKNASGSSTPTTADQFTYTATPPSPPTGPYVNALNPNQGSTVGGDFFTIIGGHFTGATGVAFGTAPPIGICHAGLGPCYIVADDNHINVNNTPPGSSPVDVTVIGPGGTSPTSNADLFTFVAPGLPTIDAVTPNQGPTFGGGQLQLFGSNLSSVDSLKIGAISVPSCAGPPGPGGCFNTGGNNSIFVNAVPAVAQTATVDITVHNVTGNSAITAADKYTYVHQPAPIVTGVSPNHGPSVGGTQVYITGEHLLGFTQVNFGQSPLPLFGGGSASDTLLSVTSPPGAVNTTPIDITVTNPTGTSATSVADHYTYDVSPPPVVTAVSPSTGQTAGGTNVWISGQNLGNATSLQFGTSNAFQFFPQSPNVLNAFSPPNPTAGPVHVIVTGPNGQSNPTAADLFTYTPTGGPVVSVVSPATGPSEGQTPVFITGQNLGNPTNVTFGGISAFGFFSPAPNLVKTSSPMINAASYPDPVDVVVTTPSGPSPVVPANDTFTYTTTPAPTITGVGPASGPPGTTVFVSGTDFGGLSGVSFGTTPATGAIFGPSLGVIQLPSPTGIPGPAVDIRVMAAGGQSAITAADHYTYAAEEPPIISSISPNSGPTGTLVNIIGEHLGGATQVTFGTNLGGAIVPNFFVRSDNLIRVQSPNLGGVNHIQVTTTAGMMTPFSGADLFFSPGYGPVVMAALPAMANQAYGGYTTVTYIKNVGTAPASVKLSYYDTTGATVGAGDSNASLPVNATWIVRQDNGNGLLAHGAGSGLISSNQPIAAFVNEFAPPNAAAPGNTTDATSYTAIQVPDGTGTSLYAPTIVNHAYGSYTTGLGVINAGNAATDVTVKYRDGGGVLQKTQLFPGVAAHAYLGIYSGDSGTSTDANLPAGFIGTASIQSSGQPLAAITNEVGAGSQFSSFDTVNRGSTSLQAPVALNHAFGGYYTGIAVQDIGGAGGAVTLRYYDTFGALAKTVGPLTLQANGSLGIYQGDTALGPPPSGSGYTAVISAGSEPIAAIVNEVAPPTSSGFQQSTSYNTTLGGLARANLPLVESSGADGWSTGLGIMNTGPTATTVSVTYFDPVTGAGIGTSQSTILQPNAFWGVYQPSAGLPSGSRASALVVAPGGRVAVICNEVNAASFMSYNGQ
jgi:hypothetical protein